MGIFIYQELSKSITREEWKRVYEETLVLVDALPLAERRTVTYAGKDLVCVMRTRERKTEWGTGWRASMDYFTLKEAEAYWVPRDLDDGQIDLAAGDAMMGALPAYMDYDWEDERVNHTYSLWDAKTQGEPYHMYLLAVACLIEDRLGEKAFVHGDITLGQCRKAVELANRYLKEPIRVPSRCDAERLYSRVSSLPLGETEKLAVFECFYLGGKDKDFYAFEQKYFGPAIIKEYWKKRFADTPVGWEGFNRNLKRYLLSGLGLEELCRMAVLKDEEGNLQYEKFIKAVMDAKLHWKEKHTQDCLEIDQDCEQPYSIWTLFAGFVFGSARNPKVDRYIPVEEIREALKRGLGTECDVDTYIDQYLKEEADAPQVDISKENLSEEELAAMAKADGAEVLTQFMDRTKDSLFSQYAQYDIADYDDLIYFKKGNTIVPGLEKALKTSFSFYHGAVKEEVYRELMKAEPEDRCVYLIEANRRLLLRECDWERIFSDIKEHPRAFARYYPAVRVVADSSELRQMVTAFVLNDELYAYVESHSSDNP